jgi:hypothetical protein
MPTGRTTQTQWRPLVRQQTAREIPPFTGLVFYGSIPPFSVTWRAGITAPELRRKQQLEPAHPGPEEVEHLQTPRDQRRLVLPSGLVAHGPAPEAVELEDPDPDDDAMPEGFDPGD